MSDQQIHTEQQEQIDKKAKQITEKAPKGWIRWSGVAGFLVVSGLILGLIYLVNSFGLKKIIETQASEAWGAKVEIGSVGFGISPVGLKLDRLQVTDPENTMSNLFELEKIRITVNLYHAVVGRFVVEDMALTGLKMDQPRKRDGALPPEVLARLAKEKAEKERIKAEQGSFNFPSMSLPDTKDILAREKLETVEAGKKLEKQISQVQEEWKEIEKNLPTSDKLKDYERQVNEVLNTKIKDLKDLETAKNKLDQIKKSWKEDQANLQKAHKFLKENQQQLTADLKALPKLPSQDLQRLLSTYSLDGSGLSNVTFLLFGEAAQEKIDLALDWYRKAEPIIAWLKEFQAEQEKKAKEEAAKPQRFKGIDVAFREFDPQPDFMVKRINFEGEIGWGHLQAKTWDLNFDHKVSKKPVRFAVHAKPAEQASGIVVEGISSAVETDQVVTQGTANWQGYQLQDWWMTKSDSLAINMAKADIDIKTNFKLIDLEDITTDVALDYKNAKFDLSASKSKDVNKYLAPLFAGIDSFLVSMELKGKPWAPAFNAKSNLDSQLSKGLNQIVKQQLADFEKDLKSQLNTKLAEVSKPLEQELAKLGLDLGAITDSEQLLKGLEGQIANQQKAVEKELNAKLDAEKKKLEKEATKKLEDKLKKALKF